MVSAEAFNENKYLSSFDLKFYFFCSTSEGRLHWTKDAELLELEQECKNLSAQIFNNI